MPWRPILQVPSSADTPDGAAARALLQLVRLLARQAAAEHHHTGRLASAADAAGREL